MLKVLKYDITEGGEIEVPRVARFLSVQEQRGRIVMWALVDDESPRFRTPIRLVGTGVDAPGLDSWKFFGTVQRGDGYVFHVFGSISGENPPPFSAAMV